MNKLVSDRLIEEIEIKPVDTKLYHDSIKVYSISELAIIAGTLNFFGLNKIDVVSSAVLISFKKEFYGFLRSDSCWANSANF